MLARPVIDLDATHTHIHSVEALSVKLSVYAALVGLLSVKTPEFGKQFVARTHQLFQQALESYNVVRARILFRFVVELAVARVISSSSVLDTASALLDAASEACEDLDGGTNDDDDDDEGHSNSGTSSGQGVKRFQCRFWSSIVLYAVPWLAHHLGDARSSELRDLMYRIQTLLERSRSPLVGKGFLSALRPTPESTDTANTDTSTNNDNHDNHHHSNTDNGSNAKGQRLGREVLEHFFQCLSDEASAENAWALREVRLLLLLDLRAIRSFPSLTRVDECTRPSTVRSRRAWRRWRTTHRASRSRPSACRPMRHCSSASRQRSSSRRVCCGCSRERSPTPTPTT